jgi:hypothetical protein
MKIDEGSLVSLDVSLYDAQGDLLEQSDEPLVYLAGHDDILPGIEAALMGKRAGDKVMLQLEPEEAFGDYDPELVLLVPVEELGEGVSTGMRVDGESAGSSGRIFTITDIAEGWLCWTAIIRWPAWRCASISGRGRPARDRRRAGRGGLTASGPDFLRIRRTALLSRPCTRGSRLRHPLQFVEQQVRFARRYCVQVDRLQFLAQRVAGLNGRCGNFRSGHEQVQLRPRAQCALLELRQQRTRAPHDAPGTPASCATARP